MKRKNFESSVCRESDQHDWRWFITWREHGEWVSFIFDADIDGLTKAVSFVNGLPMKTEKRNAWLAEMVNTYCYVSARNS